MKKILITILIILLIVLAAFTIIDGLKIGNFEILGYNEIIDINQKLETKITEASQLTSVTFPEKVSTLTAASKELVTTREKYQDKVAYSSEEDVRRANEIKTYQVDFLFTRLGNYAKKHGLTMDLQATPTSATSVYDLNFTLHGKNDSDLNFLIQNFKLTPDTNNEVLKAEFVVTELRLNADNSISNTSTSTNTGSSVIKNEVEKK